MKKVYICIPINSDGFDFETQKAIAKMWQNHFERLSYVVINPFELAKELERSYRNLSRSEPTYNEYLGNSLVHMIMCDYAFICNGWENSNGCITEAERMPFYRVKPIFERTYKL